MLSKKVRSRIKNKKWSDHSNESKFFKDLKIHADKALEDLTLIAEKIPQKHLAEMFTDEKISPFFNSLMKKQKNDSGRTFFMGYLMLQNSLNAISAVLDNKWAQKLYDQHSYPLKEIIDAIYHEKKKLNS